MPLSARTTTGATEEGAEYITTECMLRCQSRRPVIYCAARYWCESVQREPDNARARRQLHANNPTCASQVPDAVFAKMLAGLARLPTPSAVPGATPPRFATQAARSLHAALLLQSLPQQALPFAPEHLFGYISRAQPAPLSGPALASPALRFMSEKIATDERHEILPARLCQHMRAVLNSTRRPAAEQPAGLPADVRELVAMFDPDIQPLVLAACAGGEAPAAHYAFLDDPSVRTGYRKQKVRQSMLRILGVGV